MKLKVYLLHIIVSDGISFVNSNDGYDGDYKHEESIELKQYNWSGLDKIYG